MDKENVVLEKMEYFSAIKRRNPILCSNMKGSQGHDAKKISQRKTNVCPLICNLKKPNSQAWKVQWWLPSAGGWWKW